MDLEPFKGLYFPISKLPEVYIRFASSIVLAYGAIEELDLIPEKESKKNKQWIKEKKEKLEKN